MGRLISSMNNKHSITLNSSPVRSRGHPTPVTAVEAGKRQQFHHDVPANATGQVSNIKSLGDVDDIIISRRSLLIESFRWHWSDMIEKYFEKVAIKMPRNRLASRRDLSNRREGAGSFLHVDPVVRTMYQTEVKTLPPLLQLLVPGAGPTSRLPGHRLHMHMDEPLTTPTHPKSNCKGLKLVGRRGLAWIHRHLQMVAGVVTGVTVLMVANLVLAPTYGCCSGCQALRNILARQDVRREKLRTT